MASANGQSLKKAILINNIQTDLAYLSFSNRVMVVVTQFQKFGAVISVHKETTLQEEGLVSTYFTKVLFGNDEPEVHAIVRTLAERLDIDKPMLFTLALRDLSVNTVKEIANGLCDMIANPG